ncbi:MAG: class I SAM-dependent methyltransferase [Fuerstiella sp.]
MTLTTTEPKVEFTAHNVRLADGTFTKPDEEYSIDVHPWFLSARGILTSLFPDNRQNVRVADLGCLEGGYALEFARLGFDSVGIEVRETNIAACNYVKDRCQQENLTYIKDDAWNIGDHGPFDAVFCCGLLYHIDRPRRFIEAMAGATNRVLIIQTHFSVDDFYARSRVLRPLRNMLPKALGRTDKFKLSELCEHEGLMGRWFTEFRSEPSREDREAARWHSWENHRSFWIQREYLLQAIKEAGFDLVFEQFDNLRPTITESMLGGYYHTDLRGTFVGIKC